MTINGLHACWTAIFKRKHKSSPEAHTKRNSIREQNQKSLPLDESLPIGSILLNRYRIEKDLGKGSYGRVKLAKDLRTRDDLYVALKCISRASIKKAQHLIRIEREFSLLSCLDHVNIVRLIDRFETPMDIILVFEYIRNKNGPSDLHDFITSKGKLDESEARYFFKQMVSALVYSHNNCIVHRDIKPENMMLMSNGKSKLPILKLIDFGFSNLYDTSGTLHTNCGSPLYASPEIIQGIQYIGPEVDIWSLGVTLYAMLCGQLPFEHETINGLYSLIKSGFFKFPDHIPLTWPAQDLIRGMLRTDSKNRFTIETVSCHPWVIGHIPSDVYSKSMLVDNNSTLMTRKLMRCDMHDEIDEETIDLMTRNNAFGGAFGVRSRLIREIVQEQKSPGHTIYKLLLVKKKRIAQKVQNHFVELEKE